MQSPLPNDFIKSIINGFLLTTIFNVNGISNILLALIFNTIFNYNIETKIILYINKLTDKVNYLSNKLNLSIT
jgi:hypothetical protein